jgi:ATP-binding cassette subfamily F protein 3
MLDFAIKEQKRLEQEIEITKKKALTLKGESGHRTRNISAWKSRQKVVEKLDQQLRENKTTLREKNHLNKTNAPRVLFKSARHISAEIAKAEKLTKSFGGRVLFSDVDFLITGGERVGIIGRNGTGKTTLLNILMGTDTEFKGFARLGYWVRKGFLGQEIKFRNEEGTLFDELVSVKEMQQSEVKEYLAGFQFYGDDLQKPINVLSGGERVRLYLACLMLMEPDCLIMDEPTNHLDVVARDAVERALINFKGTVIAVSHDRYFLNRCVNRILELDSGKIRSYNGNYEAYRNIKEQDVNAANKYSKLIPYKLEEVKKTGIQELHI